MTVAAYPLERARDAFVAECTLLDELAASLSDEQLLLPSRCLGWSVCDVLCHLDLGMVEILVALASPTDRQAQAAPADRRLEFQGHVIEPGDFLATWVVEAAVHHLDLTLQLPDTPPPAPASLQVTRETLDALLGQPLPGDWDDTTYALKGTGRLPLTAEEAGALGPPAERFPLFG